MIRFVMHHSYLLIKDGPHTIGSVNFGFESNKSQGYPIGYRLDPDYRGKGLMTKALAFYIQKVDKRLFQACVVESNIASQRVLNKCGFRKIGTFEHYQHGTIFVYELKKHSSSKAA